MVRGADCEELLSLADDVKLDSEADDDDEKAAAAAASETDDNEKPTTSRSSRSAYVGRGNVQPAGDVSHKPGGRLPLLFARPAVTLATVRGLLPILLLGEQRHDGCEQFA